MTLMLGNIFQWTQSSKDILHLRAYNFWFNDQYLRACKIGQLLWSCITEGIVVSVNEVLLSLLCTVYFDQCSILWSVQYTLIHVFCLRISSHLLCFLLKIVLFLPENEISWSQQIFLPRHYGEPVFVFKIWSWTADLQHSYLVYHKFH